MGYFSFDLGTEAGNHDLQFDDGGNLLTVTDAEAVAQRVRQHLEFYLGEWFLNTEVGVPWLQHIYVRPFVQTTAETLLKAAILDVPGVEELTAFDVDVDDIARHLNLRQVTILSEFDEEVTV